MLTVFALALVLAGVVQLVDVALCDGVEHVRVDAHADANVDVGEGVR
jgi:hypothetical protein